MTQHRLTLFTSHILGRLSLVLFVTALLGAVSGSLPSSSAWAVSVRSLIRPTGEAAGDNFGYSVSAAGDVNGDGYADVIVGAPYNDVMGFDVGRAYVGFGGPGADNVADLTLDGDFQDLEGHFGSSVSGAGDVNGDGFDDLIVGAPDALYGTGVVTVYYGGPGADSSWDLALLGEAESDHFGGSVSGAGDVNGDGFDDLIVGAPASDAAAPEAGRAYVYYGGPGADNVPDLTLTGAGTFDYFGGSVSGAGDVNGDGFGDVIVGAFNAGPSGEGRAYVYYGGPGANAVADVILTGAGGGVLFGASVSGAGDVNGDGYADVIVGAYLEGDVGRAYVYYGGPGANTVADLILAGEVTYDGFGYSVSDAGDVNGDGHDDVIVGAKFNDAGGTNAGRSYVYYGGPGLDIVPDLILTGTAAFDNFGGSVSGAGDVNGDGYGDVIVGAEANDAAGANAGLAYVYTSRPYEVLSPNGGEQWVIGHEQKVRWLGADLADLWVSFDGGAGYSLLASGVGGGVENEFVLTAPSPETDAAKVRVSVRGELVTHSSSDASDGVFSIVAPQIPPEVAHRLTLAPTGAVAQDLFGFSVSGAGDVNGDGYDDVIVGAKYNDAGGTNAGRAYVYYGGPGSDTVADLILTGATAFDYFGGSVSGAGDVNGDGFGDVIVGAEASDAAGADAGRAYVYFGGPVPNTVADLTLTGEAPFNNFGYSVSGAGDVNRDGYQDVIVGALLNNAGGTEAGRAYVYYGGPGANTVADLVLTGAAESDNFGISVSGAGDVNGDGYSDVIVGAEGNDAGGADAGRAYVYFGGSVPNTVADLILTGAAAEDYFGLSVSGVGDVDGDGNGDVIVGAYGNDAGGVDAGRAYVYFGGPGIDTAADLTLTGAALNDQFGYSVSGAGDVNGDGYSDLVVGAQSNDAGGASAGRAYVYYGGPSSDILADLTMTGEAVGGFFGRTVSGAGDVNRDGYADVIVGALGNDAGGTDAGRAYLYDCSRYFVTAPNGGETWNVGAVKTISWLGAEPAEVWLSTDGGGTQMLLESGVGGSPSNSISIRVPHFPTKFARIRVTPSEKGIVGSDRSDSLFTIQTSVALLSMLAAPKPEGTLITWQTDPGPQDLAGYRLEKAAGSSGDWRTLVSFTRETSATDPSGGQGSTYRLFAVNGFGEELLVGQTELRSLAPLAAWPMPYRGGGLHISFATAGGLGGGKGRAELLLFDIRGRLVRRIVAGDYEAGYQGATWDGHDELGNRVSPGVYFLRSSSAGVERHAKIVVAR